MVLNWLETKQNASFHFKAERRNGGKKSINMRKRREHKNEAKISYQKTRPIIIIVIIFIPFLTLLLVSFPVILLFFPCSYNHILLLIHIVYTFTILDLSVCFVPFAWALSSRKKIVVIYNIHMTKLDIYFHFFPFFTSSILLDFNPFLSTFGRIIFLEKSYFLWKFITSVLSFGCAIIRPFDEHYTDTTTLCCTKIHL